MKSCRELSPPNQFSVQVMWVWLGQWVKVINCYSTSFPQSCRKCVWHLLMLLGVCLIWDTLCTMIGKKLMSTQNLADLPATAGSSKQRLPLSIDDPGINPISGRSLVNPVNRSPGMHLTENSCPKKIIKFETCQKLDVLPFCPFSVEEKRKMGSNLKLHFHLYV